MIQKSPSYGQRIRKFIWSDRSDVVKYLMIYVPAILSLGMCASWKNHRTDSGLDFKAVCVDGSTSLSNGPGTCSGHGGVDRYVPEEAQSDRMRALDRVIEEIENDQRGEGSFP